MPAHRRRPIPTTRTERPWFAAIFDTTNKPSRILEDSATILKSPGLASISLRAARSSADMPRP